METGAITQHIDVAQIVLYAFWVFFAGLLIYLQRESRREGYPLVSEVDGRPMDHGVWMPDPKTFLLADGTVVTVPDPSKDAQPPRLEAAMHGAGNPFVPVGDPMLAGVGPGAYTPRANRPDVNHEGHARIVPLRVASTYYLAPEDPDPRGMTVYGADGVAAGQVVDAWADTADCLLRYFEVELPGAAQLRSDDDNGGAILPGRVLLPVNFASKIDSMNDSILVTAILGAQFAAVPRLGNPDLVTLDEEERICAYYGGGYLYAEPSRQETLL